MGGTDELVLAAEAVQGLEQLVKIPGPFGRGGEALRKQVEEAIAGLRGSVIKEWVKKDVVDQLILRFVEPFQEVLGADELVPEDLALVAFDLWNALWPNDDDPADDRAYAEGCVRSAHLTIEVFDAIVAHREKIRGELREKLRDAEQSLERFGVESRNG